MLTGAVLTIAELLVSFCDFPGFVFHCDLASLLQSLFANFPLLQGAEGYIDMYMSMYM